MHIWQQFCNHVIVLDFCRTNANFLFLNNEKRSFICKNRCFFIVFLLAVLLLLFVLNENNPIAV